MNVRIQETPFTIRAAIGVAVILGISGLAFSRVFTPPINRDLAGIRRCTEGQQVVSCIKPYLKDMLSRQDVGVVMQTFSTEYGPYRCHYLGHLVGQLTYQRFGDLKKALGTCTGQCDSACTHGAAGEYFITELGLTNDGYALPEKKIERMGKQLCVTWRGCHAAGHALYVHYRQFTPALSVCATVSSGENQKNCYRGAFMEYLDSLQSVSTWATTSPTLFSNPDEYCQGFQASAREACYWYMPSTLKQMLLAKGVTLTKDEWVGHVKKVCTMLPPGPDRRSCLFGAGLQIYRIGYPDSNEVRRLCAFFKGADTPSCTNGVLWGMMEFERVDTAIAYCKELTVSSDKKGCYREVFRLAGDKNVTEKKVTPECVASESLCVEAEREQL